MAYFKHALGRTFYLSFGNLKLPTLICLHGGPGGTHELLLPLRKLSKKYRVILYDQAGGGKSSDIPKKHWRINSFVRELRALVEHLGLSDYYLYGASWGTTLALEYALRYPRGVKGVVFQSPMFSASDWQRDALRLIKKMPKPHRNVLLRKVQGRKTEDSALETAMLQYYLSHVLRSKPKLDRVMKMMLGNKGEKVYAHMWGAAEFKAEGTLKNYDKVSSLNNLKMPVLFVCGEFDEAQPVTVKRYAKYIGADVKVIKNASHVITFEKPDKLFKATAEFLDKITKESGGDADS